MPSLLVSGNIINNNINHHFKSPGPLETVCHMGSAHPHPTSGDAEPLVPKGKRFQLRLLFHGCWFHLPEGPPNAWALQIPPLCLMPSYCILWHWGQIWRWSTFMYSFNRYLLSSYYVPPMILGPGFRAAKSSGEKDFFFFLPALKLVTEIQKK